MTTLQHLKSNSKSLFVFQVLIIFVPLALLSSAATYYVYHSEQIKTALIHRQRAAASLEISRQVIDSALQEISRDIALISKNHALKIFLDQSSDTALRYFQHDLLNLARSSKLYDQIRWIDENGMERVRVNYNNGNPAMVSIEALQNKHDRYYFQDASRMNPGEIYISSFDLNVEQGQIEIPLKPMLRIAMPVFDRHRHAHGIVLLNYLGSEMLSRLNKYSTESANEIMLLNQEGYWLKSPVPEEEWGFMFGRDDLTLSRRHPSVWQRILAENEGQFENATGLWTFNTLYLLSNNQNAQGYNSRRPGHSSFWKVVAHMPPRVLYGSQSLLKPLLAMLSTLLVVLFAISWTIAHIRSLRNKAVAQVVSTNQNLENLVKERTLQLETGIEIQKQVEKELQANQFMLSETERIAHVGSWVLDIKTGQMTWSEETYRLYGQSPETDVIPEWDQFFALFHTEDRVRVRSWFEECRAGKQLPSLEFRTHKINGQYRWMLCNANLETDSEGEPLRLVGSVQDISQHKQAKAKIKEGAARTQAILETVVDGIITIDRQGIIETFNPAAERIFGYDADEMIGRNINRLMPEPYSVQHDSYLNNYLAGGSAKIIGIGRVVEGLRKDGTTFPLDLAVSETKLGEARIFTGIVRDITMREIANNKLKDALNEKEVLLKEVYHRVKNNLQVVSSLINLQARNVNNEEVLNLLKESANRIKAMALLHEKLYQSNDLAKIDFNDYVRSLIESLFNSFSPQARRITISIHIKDVFLDLDTAIPCGLIINELLSNAFKHAFPQGQPGDVEISFLRDEQQDIKLVISDNGIGLPDGLEIKKCKSLGLQLVTRLATDQLGGNVSFEKKKGTTFSIRFPLAR